MLASIVVYPRMMLEVSIVAPSMLADLLWPIVTFAALMLVIAGIIFWRMDRSLDSSLPDRKNPAQIKMALSFAALYVGILFAVAAARDLVGNDALFAIAFLSGLTDVDALTLSVSELVMRGEVGNDAAWRAIFLASISNLLFKVSAAAVLGAGSLRRVILPAGLVALLAGAAIVAFWP